MNIKNKNVTTFFILKDLSISNKIELKRLSNKSHSFDLITGNLIKDESLEDTFIHEDKNSFTNFFLLSDLQIINKTELKKTMITSHFFNLISGEIIKDEKFEDVIISEKNEAIKELNLKEINSLINNSKIITRNDYIYTEFDL